MRTIRQPPFALCRLASSRPVAASVFALALTIALSLSSPVDAALFGSTNLVTDDQAAHPAVIEDPHLVNAWGMSHSPTSPFWVSDNGTGLSTLYSINPVTNVPTIASLVVTIPGAGNPTGQVFANVAGNFNGDAFLFVSEDGTVSGWRGALGTNAEVLQPASDAVYKGSAFATIITGTTVDAYLYAANFNTAAVDVFKGNAGAPTLTGSFDDPGIPSGFSPFNIQNIDGHLFVSYALVGPTGDDVAGLGNGFVSEFDLQGNFIARVGTQGTLDSPWGLALAPSSFGQFAGDLLVGNFGDGTINAFDLATNTFAGQLHGSDGTPLAIDGLWALTAGNGGNGGSTQAIYFSAGPDDESHGLVGVIAAAPEPATFALLGVGLAMIGFARRRQ
jgi:uncharacterized protein (TIGR03118 family)